MHKREKASSGLNALSSETQASLKDHRQQLSDVLSLYSTCSYHGEETQLRHDVCFIEVTFGLEGLLNFTNNFAAIVPILYQRGQGARPVALHPFNGAIWEQSLREEKRVFIQSVLPARSTECEMWNKTIRMHNTFALRKMMLWSDIVLQPFITTVSGRDDMKLAYMKEAGFKGGGKEQCGIEKQSMVTFTALHGTLGLVSETQEQMVRHTIQKQIVTNMLYTTVRLFGNSVGVHHNNDLFDNFLALLGFVVHMTDLGHCMYRDDIITEDARHRCNNGRDISHVSPSSPLFEGGDCEDFVQTFLQIVNCIMQDFPYYERYCARKNKMCIIHENTRNPLHFLQYTSSRLSR